MSQYIIKPGYSLSTTKGIIGPPADPENPTSKEIITEKHFKNGMKGLITHLKHKKCPLIVFKSENEIDETEDKRPVLKVQQPPVEKKEIPPTINDYPIDPVENARKEKPKGAEKK